MVYACLCMSMLLCLFLCFLLRLLHFVFQLFDSDSLSLYSHLLSPSTQCVANRLHTSKVADFDSWLQMVKVWFHKKFHPTQRWSQHISLMLTFGTDPARFAFGLQPSVLLRQLQESLLQCRLRIVWAKTITSKHLQISLDLRSATVSVGLRQFPFWRVCFKKYPESPLT